MKKFIKENQILISVIICSLILGGFYYFSQINKQKSIERQTEMSIEQENKIRIENKIELDRQAKIKEKCSVFLQRNGNYLVTNETLNTNYNSCLHSNGL